MTLKKALAWLMFCVGATGFIGSMPPWRLIAPHEPLFVLELSWGAIWLEGINSLLITHDDD